MAKAKVAKPSDGPSLFDRLRAEAAPVARPLKSETWAESTKKRGPLTVRDCGCGSKGAHRAACKQAKPRRNVKRYPVAGKVPS